MIQNKAEMLQSEVNKLAREYEYMIVEGKLLANIGMADFYESIYQNYFHEQYKDKLAQTQIKNS